MVSVNAIMQQRRDTAANLTSENATYAAGELVIETDTLLVKIGDGSTSYNDLTYMSVDSVSIAAGGALMESEVTNLAQVKAFNASDYATAAQGSLADSAQQPPAEGAFVDGDKTKLDGIEASADVTDTANVTAAGALMDSELTDIAAVKALDQGVATTDSPTFAGVTVEGVTDKHRAFASYSAFTTWDATATPAVGTVASVYIDEFLGYISYVYDGTSTAISALPGWSAVAPVYLQHHGAVAVYDRDSVTTDYQTEIQEALDAKYPVLKVFGWFTFDDQINIPNHTILDFEGGKTRTGFSIKNSFNMLADAVISLSAHASNGAIGGATNNLNMWFEQPGADNTVVADLSQYPWAIEALSAQFRLLGNSLIQRAWDVLNVQDNSGRSEIGDFNFSCFNEGAVFDGPLGFIKVNSFRCSPYGLGVLGSGNHLIDAYYEANPLAVQINKCDGISIDSLSVFRARVGMNNTTATLSILPVSITQLLLDGDGSTFTCQAGTALISSVYSTKTTAPTDPSIDVSGGQVNIGILKASGGEDTEIEVTGGALNISRYEASNTASDGQGATVSAGQLSITDLVMTFGGTRTVPFIEQSGTGILRIASATSFTKTVVGTELIKVTTDVSGNDVDASGIYPNTAVFPSTQGSNSRYVNRNNRTVENTGDADDYPIGAVSTGSTTVSAAIANNLPTTGQTGSSPVWWIVETTGSQGTRLSQTATQLFGTASQKGRTFHRVNHDTWQPWYEVLTTNSVNAEVEFKTLLVNTPQTPASASATGTQGQIAWDADYIYVCTATNTWKRAALSTW